MSGTDSGASGTIQKVNDEWRYHCPACGKTWLFGEREDAERVAAEPCARTD